MKKYIIASILIHAALFLVTSIRSGRPVRVSIPVDLVFHNPPPPPAPAVKKPVKKEKEIVEPKKIEPLPKKKVEPEPKEEKKPEPKPEPRPRQEQEPRPAPAEETPPRPLRPSSQINLESARFPYTFYTNQVVKKIGRYWQWTDAYGALKAVVYFRIMRDGSIGELRVDTPSGDGLFDQQALRAVSLASPFPPLPQGYPEDHLGIYFEFAFKE